MLDVDKPRDIETVNLASIPFEMGSMLRVNNVQGTPFINIGGGTANTIKLSKSRKVSGSNSSAINEEIAGSQIGDARVYSFNLTDASYGDSNTQFDLYLYDIQTFTILKCNAFTNGNVIKLSLIHI